MKKKITLLIFLLGSVMGLQAQELTPFEAQNGKWGMKNKSGTIVVKAEYDYIYEFQEGFARVYKNELFGFLDKTGKIVIPIKYEFAYDFSDGMAVVSKGCEWGINEYQESECSGGVWGYIDKNGQEISLIYDKTWAFEEGVAWVKKQGNFGINGGVDDVKNQKLEHRKEYGWFLINKNGEKLNKLGYEGARGPSLGLSAVKLDNYWAYINNSGEEITPFIYQDARTFSDNGLARAKKEGKWGFLDKNGKEAIPFVYEYVDPMEQGSAMVKKDNKFSVIDELGKELCAMKYDSIGNFFDGVAMMNIGGSKNQKGEFSGGLWGIIAKNGSEIVPPSFSDISENYELQTLLYFVNDKKYGFLNKKTGKQVIPAIYKELSYICNGGGWGKFFDDGLLAVKKNDHWGMIDTTGKEVIPVKYDQIHEFKEGLAAVGFGGKERDRDYGTDYEGDNVFIDSKYGFIDRKGNTAIPFVYDSLHWACDHDAGFYSGLAAVQQKGKWGFIDKSGKVIIPFKYDAITWGVGFMDNKKCGVVLDDRTFYIDKNGIEIKE